MPTFRKISEPEGKVSGNDDKEESARDDPAQGSTGSKLNDMPTPPESRNPHPVQQTDDTMANRASSSRFKGVYQDKRQKSWRAQIGIGRKLHYVGNYRLETNAAFAYDQAVSALLRENLRVKRGTNWKTNFESVDEYEKAKANELEVNGIDARVDDSLPAVTDKAQRFIDALMTKTEATGGNDNSSSACTNEIGSKNNSKETPQGQIRTQKTSSKFMGVAFKIRELKYEAYVNHNAEKKKIYLGQYRLESDAAFAYDEAVKTLKENGAKTNFTTKDQYEQARSRELDASGLNIADAGSIDDISVKVQRFLDKLKPKDSTLRRMGSNSAGTETDEISMSSDAKNEAILLAAAQKLRKKRVTNTNVECSSKSATTSEHALPLSECQTNESKTTTKAGIVGLEITNEKRKPRARNHTRKINAKMSPPQTVVDEINARNNALAQKWGPLFADQDWLRANYLEAYQRGMEAMLADLRTKYVQFTIDLESRQPSAGDRTDESSRPSVGHPSNLDGKMEKSATHSPPLTGEDIVNTDVTPVESTTAASSCEKKREKPLPFFNVDTIDNSEDRKEELDSLGPSGTSPSSKQVFTGIECSLDDGEDIFDAVRNADTDDAARPQDKSVKVNAKKRSETCTKPNAGDLPELSFNKRVKSLERPSAATTLTGEAIQQSSPRATQSEGSLSSAKSELLPTRLSSDAKRNELIPLQPDQTSNLPFPVGCNVWTSFRDDGAFFLQGEVVGVSFNFVSRELFYAILMSEGDKSWFNAKELAYAPASPIYYSPSRSFDKKDGLYQGEILLCRRKPQRLHDNLAAVNKLNEALLEECQTLAKSKSADSGCHERIRDIIHQLDTIDLDQLIFEQTEIKKTVESVSKLVTETSKLAEWSHMARNLSEKWVSQVKNDSQRYYTVLVRTGSETDELKVIEDVPSSHIKHQSNISIKTGL